MTSSYSQSTLRDIMNRCFNGEKIRNCRTCPAHPKNGGECCFGDVDEYDETDKHCRDCLHKSECRSEVFERATAVSNRVGSGSRFSVRPSSASSGNLVTSIGRSSNARPVLRSSENKPILSSATATTRPLTKKEADDLTPLQHFLFVCVWGILEGMFVTAAEYMRTNRPSNRR